MTRIYVSVVPKSSQQKIEWFGANEAKVWVHATPEKGKANKEVCDVIAHSLGVPSRCVTVSAGETSRKKIINISIRYSS